MTVDRFDQELADTIEAERLRRKYDAQPRRRTDSRGRGSCPYCGRLTVGEACRLHADLPALDRAPRDRFDPDALALERWADRRNCERKPSPIAPSS